MWKFHQEVFSNFWFQFWATENKKMSTSHLQFQFWLRAAWSNSTYCYNSFKIYLVIFILHFSDKKWKKGLPHPQFQFWLRTDLACQAIVCDKCPGVGKRSLQERHSTCPGVNLIYVLREAFAHSDPQSAKKTENLNVFFVLSGPACKKAAHRMLVKWRPVVNFTNILRTAFVLILFWQKVAKVTVSKKKLQKHFCAKKLLVKCCWNWHLNNFAAHRTGTSNSWKNIKNIKCGKWKHC